MLSTIRSLNPLSDCPFHSCLTFHRSSNARLETKMNLLIAEIRAGKREGSVISTQTFDTTARNDQEIWEALRRELEDIGISPAVITEKRQFIITWFQEAVAAGKLEEDAPSEYDDRAVSLYESDDLAGTSDEDSAPDRQISTMTIGPHTTKRNTNEESRPNAPRLSRQPADVSNLRPRQGKGKSQFGVSYLMKMLRGRDQRFLEAARAGDESMVKKLLEKGVDIQSQGLQNHETDTALHLASINGKEATVRLLLSKGADVHAKSEKGWTALHQAVYCGNKQVVELLLEKGADICAKSEKGWTALYQAACCDNKQVVELLLKNGADVYAKTEGGGTALRQAAYGGHEQVVKMLLEKGADVHAKSVDGWTALHEAAYGGHEQVVRLLLENGAGLESNALSGSTALMEAAIRGHVSVVQLLLDKGAKVDRKDKKGRTALPMAGNETVSQLLRKAGAGR